MLWVGTSAGVVVTMSLPSISATTTKLSSVPSMTGIPHGHTGHVRFLTAVEMSQVTFNQSEHVSGDNCPIRKRHVADTWLLVMSVGCWSSQGETDMRTSVPMEAVNWLVERTVQIIYFSGLFDPSEPMF